MVNLTLAESLQLKQISHDVFQNVHEPWTWPNSAVVPGGLLMSECAVAAYHTAPDDFILDGLQASFLLGAKAKVPMIFRVTRLSNGRRFAVRAVVLEQNGVPLLHATVSFVNQSPWIGPSMKSTSRRKTSHSVTEITLDDLEENRGPLGPFMKFQRLPLQIEASSKDLEGSLSLSVAQIAPRIKDSDSPITHTLGILNLSDYHVMDSPLQLSGITFGHPAIGDKMQTRTLSQIKVGTTLNHSIHFHVHDGYRADDLTYIEAEVIWVKDGRAMVVTKIFTKDGLLIATCTQEAFHVLSDHVKIANSKL